MIKLLFLTILFSCNVDSDHVFHVDGNLGSDSNGGLAQQYPVALAADAEATIGAAIVDAGVGDTIIVWPDTYAESVTFADHGVELVGSRSRGQSIIAPGSANHAISSTGKNDIRIANLTLAPNGSNKFAANLTGDHIEIDNIVIDLDPNPA